MLCKSANNVQKEKKQVGYYILLRERIKKKDIHRSS